MIDVLKNYGEVLENVDLKKYNTYHIGGTAKYMVFPLDIDKLQKLIKYLNENNIKHMVLGNGSNVIFSENLYEGVIIRLEKFKDINIDDTKVRVSAGVMLPKLVQVCVNENLAGLEWAAGIPGTIGGSVAGNAGAYKSEIFDFIIDVTTISPEGNIKVLKKEDIKYDYRYSEFKDKYKDYVIISVNIKLEKGDKEESLEIIERRRQKRLETQPLEYPSAGSVFRNPEGDASGRIIEQEINFKGKRIGGAEVSKKHANFIINNDNASSKDIKDLIELIHSKVLEKTGIDLIVEQEFINWE